MGPVHNFSNFNSQNPLRLVSFCPVGVFQTFFVFLIPVVGRRVMRVNSGKVMGCLQLHHITALVRICQIRFAQQRRFSVP